MQETLLYAEVLKRIADIGYGKECLFYDNGDWYSRDHSRNLTHIEVCSYVMEQIHHYEWLLEEGRQEEIGDLVEENNRLREALEKISTTDIWNNPKHEDYEMIRIAESALNEEE